MSRRYARESNHPGDKLLAGYCWPAAVIGRFADLFGQSPREMINEKKR
jgi:hypothetical protein